MSIAIECVAALAMGLFGGVHCAAMCGPVCAVLSRSGRRPITRNLSWATITQTLPPNLGRVTTYTILGALAGGLGGAFRSVLPLEEIGVATSFATAIILVAAGLALGGFIRKPHAGKGLFVSAVSKLFSLVQRGGDKQPSTFGQFLAGMVWGLLPCGLLYGALALALTTGSPLNGALVMATFGLSTLPVLIVFGTLAATLGRLVQNPRLRATAGLMIAASGALHASFAWASLTTPVVQKAAPIHAPATGDSGNGPAEAPAPCPYHRIVQ